VKTHKYTPDVFIVWAPKGKTNKVPRPWLAEVKYKKDFEQHEEEYAPKFAAAEAYAKERGWRFEKITEDFLPPVYLKNILFLRHYRSSDASEETVMRAKMLISHLYEMETSTPQKLIEAAYADKTNQMYALHVLWQLVARKEINTDLSVPLTNNSLIWLPDKYFDDILDPETYR